MPKIVDLTNERYGLLKITSKAKPVDGSNTSYWNAKCKCGKKLVVSYSYLHKGERHRKSCGCAVNSFIAESQRKRLASMPLKQRRTINEKRSASLLEFWDGNDEARNSHSKAIRKGFKKHDTNSKLSAITRNTWKDPNIRSKRVKGLNKAAKNHYCKTPEGRAAASERRKKLVADPEHIARSSQAQRASYATRPERREKLIKSLTTPESRARASLNCLAQRGRKTKPEQKLEDAVGKRWFVYTGDNQRIGSQPVSADFVIKKLKLLVQVDGCFWHGCKRHGKEPNGDFAKAKRAKDRVLTKYAEDKGWTVLRFWEHEINGDIDSVVRQIKSARRKLRNGV